MGDVSLGREASVWYNTVVRADIAPISIGDQSNIQDLVVMHADEGIPCRVGARVGVGHRAVLHGCTVEDDSLIGMGSILLNGVHVGAGSVVGAGAVLLEGLRVPAGSLVVGVPASVVRPVDDDLRGRIEQTWRHYVELAKSHGRGDFRRHPAS